MREIGSKSFSGIVGQLREQRLVDGERPGCCIAERVAVGLGLGHRIGADVAAGAGLVLHHERDAEIFRQPLRNQPRSHVGGRARQKWHDDLDRP